MNPLEQLVVRWTDGDATLALTLQVFLVVLAVVVTNYVLRRVLKGLENRTRQTDTPWDDALITAARKPLTLLAWIVGLAFAAEMIEAETQVAVFKAVPVIRTIGVVAAMTWFLTRFIDNVQASIVRLRQLRGEQVDKTTVDAIAKLLRISVIITGFLVGLQTLGFSISGVLAFGGIGGIAVGFAAKDLLANFFGGLMIYLDRPFSVGDWIRSPDKQIEGTVEEIGWRLTRIRTFDQRPLYLPNAIFTQIAVENPSRMTHRRIYETIGVRYEDMASVEAIVSDIQAYLLANSDIDSSQTMIVNLVGFSASSVDIMVYTFTKTTVWVDFHAIKQKVLLAVADIVARHGAEIAYPTRTLHVNGVAGLSDQTVAGEPPSRSS